MKKHRGIRFHAAMLRTLGYHTEYELRIVPVKGRKTAGVLLARGADLDTLLQMAEVKRIALQPNRRMQLKLLAMVLDKPGSFMGIDMATGPDESVTTFYETERVGDKVKLNPVRVGEGVISANATTWKPGKIMREEMEKTTGISLPKPKLRASGVALPPLAAVKAFDELSTIEPNAEGPLVWDEEKKAYVQKGKPQ